jgi:hypothetical protein
LLRIGLDGEVMAGQGAMVAYQGCGPTSCSGTTLQVVAK